jgi:hypothetical protein
MVNSKVHALLPLNSKIFLKQEGNTAKKAKPRKPKQATLLGKRTEAVSTKNYHQRRIYPVVCDEKGCRSAGFRLALPGLVF